MIWNDLEQPRVRKKQHETLKFFKKQPTVSKKQPETTCKEQILTSWSSSTWKIINWRAPMSQRINRSIPCLQYFVSSVHMQNNGRQKIQSKWQNQMKESKITWFNFFVNWFQTFSIWYFLWVLSLTAQLESPWGSVCLNGST